MKSKRIVLQGAVGLLLAATAACSSNKSDPPGKEAPQPTNTDITNLKFTVEAAPEWTALFKRNSGWFGADGIFAIPKNGVDAPGTARNTETMLLFSDTMIGDIKDGKLSPGYTMINNSVAILKGAQPTAENIEFYWDRDPATGKHKSLFIPNTPAAQPGEYYWLGDGFVNTAKNNDTYVFGYRVKNINNQAFGFQEVGNTLIVIPAGSKPPFRDQRQLDTPFFLPGSGPGDYGSLGGGIFVNTKEAGAPQPDGYVYVYGVRGKAKNVMVARVLPADIEDFGKWRYWDGTDWNADLSKIANITDRASNELSVTPLPDGRYAMVFQTEGLGKTVGLRLGLKPQGPWGPPIDLWDCTEDVKMDKDFFPYNAKVHANLSEPGELLISYNINSFDFFKDILVYPNLYRPRFIKVKLQ
ncbi:DUF4185 domain-containing protein [Hymenobacter sp. ASUV-10]|uniref:DUF4185 domain-containing protein n=1 Tax=Hymenobacter aranciens TaxID=3063996 RepID=A0ABT9BH70_9BACT|nr:DUF4185 domain-containing protein [Hymenobacter sp. ASUV-10]MDO7875863.1 DUF4185 domain-containing protein [Hymenobacter sp. ASUV-10]